LTGALFTGEVWRRREFWPRPELCSLEKSRGEGSFGLIHCLDKADGTGEGGLTGGGDVGIRGGATVGVGVVIS